MQISTKLCLLSIFATVCSGGSPKTEDPGGQEAQPSADTAPAPDAQPVPDARPTKDPRRYALDFSTYLGGQAGDQLRDVAVDGAGNIYVAGGTSSTGFHRTVGSPHQGAMDAMVMKFNPSGQLAWSRLLGGPSYDRAYAIEVDDDGNVYVAGRAGPGFPTTPSS